MNPLQGVKIVELTTQTAGPLATNLLADQGADVIRFESIGIGDPSRYAGGMRNGYGACYTFMNRNKRSLAIDIKKPASRPIIEELIKDADVFVQNARAGALERSGCGFEDFHKINPNLIYASISGFGADGPGSDLRVYDPIIQVISGFAASQGAGQGKPQLINNIVSDKVAAYTAAQAISSSLFARERGTVGGHHLQISMLDASLAFLWNDAYWNHGFGGDEPINECPPIGEIYRIMATKDNHITCIVVGDAEFNGACQALGCEHLKEDARFNTLTERFTNLPAMMNEFEKYAANFNTVDLLAALEKAGVPCAKVNALDEVLEDPRVKHAGAIIEYDHPVAGRLRQTRPPVIFGDEPCSVRSPAPALGEHTDEILAGIGYSDDKIVSLRDKKVVA
ncbi:MAG: CoA transferase [Gammaproteobacteria bacterium]|nr:MAG: CoA transferase [Gammaproteobacteria bacterium]RLA53079.1 MAG: CoA transferase [Gammaproteobacteria bacterium]